MTSLGHTCLFRTIPCNVLHLLNATYVCPCENAPEDRSITTFPKVCPWLLWIVIAHASLNGNWVYLPRGMVSILSSLGSYSYFTFSQVTFFTETTSPESNNLTFITSSLNPMTIPRLPFTHLPSGSFLANITFAWVLSFKS